MAPQQNGEDPLRRLREDPLLLAYQPAPELPSEADEAFNALIREWIVHNELSVTLGVGCMAGWELADAHKFVAPPTPACS
jgi:hypothetical protein